MRLGAVLVLLGCGGTRSHSAAPRTLPEPACSVATADLALPSIDTPRSENEYGRTALASSDGIVKKRGTERPKRSYPY